MPRRSLTLLLALFSAGALAWTPPGGHLPLGRPDLPETREVSEVAPGIVHWRIRRGQPNPRDAWTVTVAVVPDALSAAPVLRQLATLGLAGRLDRLPGARPDGRPVGFAVRVGRYASREAATPDSDRLKAAGLKPSTQFTGEDGAVDDGPWVVDLLVVSPTARARLQAALATDVLLGRETTSSLARRHGAIAAVNGGFFETDFLNGSEGDLAGLSLIAGELVSEATPGRPILLLGGPGGPLSAHIVRGVQNDLSVTANGTTRPLNGLNRRPRADELIVFSKTFGGPLPGVSGAQATLDAGGTVTALGDTPGGNVAEGSRVLIGTGRAADWLRTTVKVGDHLDLRLNVSSGGQPLAFTPDQSAVNGGPTLLVGGQEVRDWAAEGWTPSASDGGLGYANFVTRRNPRTAVGLAPDGSVLLLEVDGRQPDYSVGTSVPETAALLRSLGARDAINLDGGGSSALVIGGALQGRPSDATGERPDGDAVLLLP